jgi:hypothetical protein
MIRFFVAVLVAASLSHAITSIPINGIKASATLPDIGQTTYRPENMVMKKHVHPFFQVWGAKYKNKPITLEFLVEAQRLDLITIYNGFLRDSSAYTNYSLAKTIKIYQNTTDNLIKVHTLAKPNWRGHKDPLADVIVFDKPLKNVFKIIIEIEDIYPGKLYQDVCIALIKFWGFTRLPHKPNFAQLTDVRDGQTYRTISVGDRIWMAQDLRYKTSGSRPFTDANRPNVKIPTDAGLEYPTADIEYNICPEGWRLPTQTEFANLLTDLSPTASYGSDIPIISAHGDGGIRKTATHQLDEVQVARRELRVVIGNPVHRAIMLDIDIGIEPFPELRVIVGNRRYLVFHLLAL